MKNSIKLLLIICLFFTVSCESTPNKTINVNKNEAILNKFNSSLGTEKAKVFNELVASFNSFLDLNYSDNKSYDEKIKRFLNDYNKNGIEFKKDIKSLKQLKSKLENSGLRKDIKLYGYEDYESVCNLDSYEKTDSNQFELLDSNQLFELFEEIEIVFPEDMDSIAIAKFYEREKQIQNRIDSTLSNNINGLYLCSLKEFANQDSLIYYHLDVISVVGDISPSILTKVYTNDIINYSNPLHIRMLVVDLYLDLVYYYTKS